MSTNLWNLAHSRTSFMIRERTHNQIRHLESIEKAKSTLGFQSNKLPFDRSQNNGDSRVCVCSASRLNQKQSGDNEAIESRVKSLSKKSTYVNILQKSSSLIRLRQQQKIEKQNCKMFQRLIKAKPCISESKLKQNHFLNLRYRKNIIRTKYINPDYSCEANLIKMSQVNLRLKPVQSSIKTASKGESVPKDELLKVKNQASKRVKSQVSENPNFKNHSQSCSGPKQNRN